MLDLSSADACSGILKREALHQAPIFLSEPQTVSSTMGHVHEGNLKTLKRILDKSVGLTD